MLLWSGFTAKINDFRGNAWPEKGAAGGHFMDFQKSDFHDMADPRTIDHLSNAEWLSASGTALTTRAPPAPKCRIIWKHGSGRAIVPRNCLVLTISTANGSKCDVRESEVIHKEKPRLVSLMITKSK